MRKSITVEDHDIHHDPMKGAMLRNCYMLAGTVLFDLKRYNEAIDAYSYVSSLYPNDPFVLETFVQISNCWRRLDQADNARGASSRPRSRSTVCRPTPISRRPRCSIEKNGAIAGRHGEMVMRRSNKRQDCQVILSISKFTLKPLRVTT